MNQRIHRAVVRAALLAPACSCAPCCSRREPGPRCPPLNTKWERSAPRRRPVAPAAWDCGCSPSGRWPCAARGRWPRPARAPGRRSSRPSGTALPDVEYEEPWPDSLTPQNCSPPTAFPSVLAPASQQTMALIDAYNDPTVEHDLEQYDQRLGLPECTNADGCFTKVEMQGGSPTEPDWAQEIATDIEVAHGICEGCHILLVEAIPTATQTSKQPRPKRRGAARPRSRTRGAAMRPVRARPGAPRPVQSSRHGHHRLLRRRRIPQLGDRRRRRRVSGLLSARRRGRRHPPEPRPRWSLGRREGLERPRRQRRRLQHHLRSARVAAERRRLRGRRLRRQTRGGRRLRGRRPVHGGGGVRLDAGQRRQQRTVRLGDDGRHERRLADHRRHVCARGRRRQGSGWRNGQVPGADAVREPGERAGLAARCGLGLEWKVRESVRRRR